jgi:hypothetical protein
MRFVLVLAASLGILLASTTAAPALAGTASDAAYVDAQQPTGQADIDVDVNRGGGWWASPLWIAVGVIALLLIVAIIAMAARGGGTTVIKD